MQQIFNLISGSAASSGAAAPVGFPTSANPTRANSKRYHGRRRLVQALSFALAIGIPASGLLRMDPSAGALVVLDRQIWFADFFLIAGLWIMLASALVILYSVAGTVFCGWVCPQNILSEWANFVTRKFLGRRAKVNMDGSAPLVFRDERIRGFLNSVVEEGIRSLQAKDQPVTYGFQKHSVDLL